MVDLSGSLACFELAPLVRFLCGLHKQGKLVVANEHWSGRLSFCAGQLISASIRNEHGRAALEFIVGAMRDAEFEFFEDAASPRIDPELGPDPLALLQQLASDPSRTSLAAVPGPSALPRVTLQPGAEASQVVLRRSEIALLPRIDGRTAIGELADRYGLLQTVRGLAHLHEMGFVEFEAPVQPIASEVPPNATVSGEVAREGTGKVRGAVRVGTELLQAVVFTALLVLGVRSLMLNFRVEGISMQPTFESGQVLLVNRAAYFHVDWQPLARLLPTRAQGTISYLFGGPQRGDVVIFHSPVQPGTDYIKRIIGLPGDRVAVSDGSVYVNDTALKEPYIQIPADYRFPATGSTSVPTDSYFVLGDNRPESLDSHFGWFVPVDDLVGRAWVRYWPPDELGLVGATFTRS
jgi:signal peptidase I